MLERKRITAKEFGKERKSEKRKRVRTEKRKVVKNVCKRDEVLIPKKEQEGTRKRM